MEVQISERGFEPEEAPASKVTGTALERQLQKQEGKCYYSGAILTLKNVSLDHITPLSRGGKHTADNVVLCTRQVNRMKGQMTAVEFVEICQAIASTPPVRVMGPLKKAK